MMVKKIDSIFFVMLFFFLLMNCQKEQMVQKPNVLLICVDDLRPELKSFGAEYLAHLILML